MSVPPLATARRAWWAAGLWAVLIFVSVPAARGLQDLVAGSVGRAAYLWAAAASLSAALLLGGLALRRVLGGRAWGRLPWLLGPAAIAAVYGWHLRQAPEEALHFAEYGVLGLLLQRALRHRLPDAASFPASLLAATLFGILDELTQWLMPGRFWDLRDAFVNAVAALLALTALAGGLRPPELLRRPAAGSVRVACGLAAALVLAVVLALSNTPPVEQALARALPVLRYQVARGVVMTEYGYLHEVPGVGRLYSRLGWGALRAADEGRAAAAARVLDGYPGDDDYKVFLRDYPPFRDPFLHELRVHIFRRDRYRARASSEPPPPPAERRRMAATAWCEDQLLQACCGATLAASGYALPADAWAPLAPWIDRDTPYTSAVGSHLIVRFRLAEAWIAAVLCWAALGAAAWRWGRAVT